MAGIVLLITFPITIIPSCILWIITDRLHLIEIFEGVFIDDY